VKETLPLRGQETKGVASRKTCPHRFRRGDEKETLAVEQRGDEKETL
jgi:hypothetical protein